MALTVGDLANRYGVSSQTVRTWCDTFGEWLSPSATPPTGEVRTFTEDDLSVLGLVASMRDDRIGYDDIRVALASGERQAAAGRETIEDRTTGTGEGEQGRSLALVVRYEAQIAFRDGQIAQLQQTEESLREELDSVREALTEAQRRATRAETILEQYEQQEEATASPGPPEAAEHEEDRPTEGRIWWQFWRR